MIDAWRGIAALLVVLHHTSDSFKFGGEGVILFFVISGYCISASSEASARSGHGFRNFMFRRFRRIYPPYFFSVLLILAFTFSAVAIGYAKAPPWTFANYIQNFTLTQWFALVVHPELNPAQNAVNWITPYWSLQYEEQFYLLMGLLCLLPFISRGWIILCITACSIPWMLFFPHTFRGIFLELWLYFAIGCFIYYRLCRVTKPHTKHLLDALLLLTTILSAIGWLTDSRINAYFGCELMFISCTFACILIALRRYDDPISRSAFFRPFLWLGTITYSLYLIHVILLCQIKMLANIIIPPGFTTPNLIAQIAIHIAAASLFWSLCERPFLNKPQKDSSVRLSKNFAL